MTQNLWTESQIASLEIAFKDHPVTWEVWQRYGERPLKIMDRKQELFTVTPPSHADNKLGNPAPLELQLHFIRARWPDIFLPTPGQEFGQVLKDIDPKGHWLNNDPLFTFPPSSLNALNAQEPASPLFSDIDFEPPIIGSDQHHPASLNPEESLPVKIIEDAIKEGKVLRFKPKNMDRTE